VQARGRSHQSAKRPLIILGKGAAYAQADADIRALVEKTGIPYLPMSMARGLLPDTHGQSASAARSYVLPEADVVMLIGAPQLLAGQGQDLGWRQREGVGRTEVRPDRHLAAGSRQQRPHRCAGRW
jgi:oxalyl-CoA decarboxylase